MNERTRECGCPDYFERCTHMDDLVVAYITAAASRSEYTRRTGIERKQGDSCVGCGYQFRSRPGAVGQIAGPSLFDVRGPFCFCCLPLLPVNLDEDDVLSVTPDDLESLWQERVELMAELSAL